MGPVADQRSQWGLPGVFFAGHVGVGFLEPSKEFFFESGDLFGVGGGEVVLFADIFAEVVEFVGVGFLVPDELPVAVANGGGPAEGFAGAMVGEVLIDGLLLEGSFLGEQGEIGNAIEALGVGGGGDSGEGEQGRKEVGSSDGGVHGGAGGEVVGPTIDEGDTDTAFVEGAFDSSQGWLFADASVVGSENHDGVFAQLELVQSRQDVGDGLIHTG